jgi:hypothetical protein
MAGKQSGSNGAFSLKAYRGDAKTLLAFNLEAAQTRNLAGFTVQYQTADGQSYYLYNDLHFETPALHAQDPTQPATSSINAPIHKFRWLHVPGSMNQGTDPFYGSYTYTVTPRYFDGNQRLLPIDRNLGKSLTVPVEPFQKDKVALSFTRGYVQSQAFVHQFGPDAKFRPAGKELLFDTSQVAGKSPRDGKDYTFDQQYSWMGFTARRKIFEILHEVEQNTALTLDVFAYDLNEPDVMKSLLKLAAGGRVRIILDNAPLHHSAKGNGSRAAQGSSTATRATKSKTATMAKAKSAAASRSSAATSKSSAESPAATAHTATAHTATAHTAKAHAATAHAAKAHGAKVHAAKAPAVVTHGAKGDHAPKAAAAATHAAKGDQTATGGHAAKGATTGPTPEDQFETQFKNAATGHSQILRGHFGRFAHDKIFIVRQGNTATKVLTGSTNFSVTGLYVNSNHVVVFSDPTVAAAYAEVFDAVWNSNVSESFNRQPQAAKVDSFNGSGVPATQITFSPHQKPFATKLLGDMADRIKQEGQDKHGSVLFAVMDTGVGTGPVLPALTDIHKNTNIFSYGISDSNKGIFLYSPRKKTGVKVTGKPGQTVLPPPFDQVPNVGAGHQIHHKFVVCGFNGANPVVYCGSSNLALGGEENNGDNLIAIHDGDIATVFMIEALSLVDHFDFLDRYQAHKAAAQKSSATGKTALKLPSGSKQKAAALAGWFLSTTDKWAQPYFDQSDLHCVDRQLFGG